MLRINKVLMKWLMVFGMSVLISVIQTTVFCADIIVDSYTKSTLPPAGSPGRLVRVTDDVQGLWMDDGSQWFNLHGEVVNVKDFGAKGDGITDDTVAIQNAVDTAQIVVFPPGNYRMSQINITKPNQKIYGTGTMHNVRILLNDANNGFNFQPTSGSTGEGITAMGFEIQNLLITSLNGTNGMFGIRISSNQTPDVNVSSALIRRVRFLNLGGNAVLIEHPVGLPTTAPTWILFEEVSINNAARGIVLSECGDTVRIEKCSFGTMRGTALHIDQVPGAVTVGVFQTEFAQNQAEDILILKGGHVTITESRFEQGGVVKTTANKAMIDIQAPSEISHVLISGNYMNGNSSTQTTSLIRLDRITGSVIKDNYLGGATNGILMTGFTADPIVVGNKYSGVTNDITGAPGSLARLMDGQANNKNRLVLPDNGRALELWSQQGNQSAFEIKANGVGDVQFNMTRTPVLDFQTYGVTRASIGNYGFYNVAALSATGTQARNLRGQATLNSGVGSVGVTFSTAEPDASYYIQLTGNGNNVLWVTNKTATGFTINRSSTTGTRIVDWLLVR